MAVVVVVVVVVMRGGGGRVLVVKWIIFNSNSTQGFGWLDMNPTRSTLEFNP